MEENGMDVVEAVKKWLAENGYDYAVRAYLPGEAGKGVKKERTLSLFPPKWKVWKCLWSSLQKHLMI